MDADFLDLVLWILVPLIVLFTLWAVQDCLRSPDRKASTRYCFALLILLLPIWGAILWFRDKAITRAGESSLMSRVRKRRSGE